MTITLLLPEQVRDAFGRIVDEEIYCEQRDNMLLLDTPYVTGRGYLLRAYISFTGSGIMVSDGGFTVSQLETFAINPKARSHRYVALEQIARRLGISWGEGEFYYTEETLEDAMRRLKVLAQAVLEGQELIRPRIAQSEEHILRLLLALAETHHLAVKQNVRVPIKGQDRPLLIDMEIERDAKKAAVDIVLPRSSSGATSTLNRMVADFHAISRTERYKLLVGVYDAEGPLSESRYQERFTASSPRNALLLPSDAAIEQIQDRLAA